jgi:hypothetical protein
MSQQENRQFHSTTELSLYPGTPESLIGRISEPVTTISKKPDQKDELVTLRLVEEGAGLWGLDDWRDSREWSGIQNHMWFTARYASHLAGQMNERGYPTDPRLVASAMCVSHAGRRQWDEARWYPEAVPDAQAKASVTNETLGLRLIHGKVPDDVFDLVTALAHTTDEQSPAIDPAVLSTWNYRIAQYVDHRTTQQYESLAGRMTAFIQANFLGGGTADTELAKRVQREVEGIVYSVRNATISGTPVRVDAEVADRKMDALGVPDSSPRLSRHALMELIVRDAETEGILRMQKVNTELSPNTVPAPQWEKDLRFQYVAFSARSIRDAHANGQLTVDPVSPNWWDKEALQLINE